MLIHHPLGFNWHPLEGAGTWMFWEFSDSQVINLFRPGDTAQSTAAFAAGPLAAISPKPSLSSLVFKKVGRDAEIGRFGCQQQETWYFFEDPVVQNRGHKEVPVLKDGV